MLPGRRIACALLPLLAGCGGSCGKPPAPPAATTRASDAPRGSAPDRQPPQPAVRATRRVIKAVALPGSAKPASLDYIAFEPGKRRVWVPVGNTASVDVYDVAGGAFTRVGGFARGLNAVSLGDGVAYIGNWSAGEVCAVDVATLKRGKCAKLPTPTDGVAYVASTREVWVTTPRDHSLTVLDADLAAKTVIKLDGESEGYAVDQAGGRFFTNLEDKDRTVVVDVTSHKPVATWKPACGGDGPRGLVFDASRDYLIVACTDHVQVLDAAHDGAPLGKLDTGGGVDNIGFAAGTQQLFVAAGRAARLTIAHVGDGGALERVATVPTVAGARNVVADGAGDAYVADPRGARLLVVGNAGPAP